MVRDHEITLTIPEIEVCVDTSTPNDPYAEHCARPDDKLVQRAVGILVNEHPDRLEDICAELYEADCAERRAGQLEYEEDR